LNLELGAYVPLNEKFTLMGKAGLTPYLMQAKYRMEMYGETFTETLVQFYLEPIIWQIGIQIKL